MTMCNPIKRWYARHFWVLLQAMFMNDWNQTAQRLKLQERLLIINKRNIIRWSIYRDNNFHSRRQVFKFFLKSWVLKLKMYRSNRSFSIPQGNPPGIWLFWKLLFEFPPTRAKMAFKCQTLGSIQVIKCLHPEDISQAQKWQKDGRNAFNCRTKSL